MVDTGATLSLLTAEDARALNIDPPASAFNCTRRPPMATSQFRPRLLRELRIDDITVHDVDGLVARPGALNISLLGMSFLKKLESFQVADGRFVMKQ